MKSVSLIALATALTLSFSPISFAQVSGTTDSTTSASGSISAGGNSVDAGTGTSVGADVSADGSGVSVGVDADADAGVSAGTGGNASGGNSTSGSTTGTSGGTTTGGTLGGTTSGGTTSGGATTGTTTTTGTTGSSGGTTGQTTAAGTNDDGSVDDDGACPEGELSSFADMSDDQMATLSATSNARIILIDDCDSGGSLVSGLDNGTQTELNAAVFANQALSAELAARGVGNGEIVAVAVEGESVTIYAEGGSND